MNYRDLFLSLRNAFYSRPCKASRIRIRTCKSYACTQRSFRYRSCILDTASCWSWSKLPNHLLLLIFYRAIFRIDHSRLASDLVLCIQSRKSDHNHIKRQFLHQFSATRMNCNLSQGTICWLLIPQWILVARSINIFQTLLDWDTFESNFPARSYCSCFLGILRT